MSGIFDTGIFDVNLFDNAESFRIAKISNIEAVIRIIGAVDITISASQLITKAIKYGSITNGSNILTLNSNSDNVGICVGSVVTDGASIHTTVTAINAKRITLAANMPLTDAAREFVIDTQVAGAGSLIDINKMYFSSPLANPITIKRNATTEFILTGSDHWDLNNMQSHKNEEYPLEIVTTSASSLIIMELRKSGDWGTNNNSYGNI